MMSISVLARRPRAIHATRHAIFSFVCGTWRKNYRPILSSIDVPTLVITGKNVGGCWRKTSMDSSPKIDSIISSCFAPLVRATLSPRLSRQIRAGGAGSCRIQARRIRQKVFHALAHPFFQDGTCCLTKAPHRRGRDTEQFLFRVHSKQRSNPGHSKRYLWRPEPPHRVQSFQIDSAQNN